MKTKYSLATLLTIFFYCAISAGGVPLTMNYQGRLLDDTGEPLNTNVNVTIGIYTNSAGGSSVYEESVGLIPVQNGIYTFQFGTNAAGIRAALLNSGCWLELSIDGSSLSPRQELLASPYSIRSDETDHVGSNTTFATDVIPGNALIDASVTSNKLASDAFIETDPIWSAASNAVIAQAAHGETAYGWGNHATNTYAPESYVDSATGTLHTTVSTEIDSDVATLSNSLDVVALNGEVDPVFTSSVAATISSGDTGQWHTAYSWGNHASENYLTNYTETDPVWTNAQASGFTVGGQVVLPTGGLTVGTTQIVVLANGNVGIGTSNPTNELAVNGTIKCKEVIVTLDGWSDFVFEKDYELMSLNEVDEFIQDQGHLPGIPSAEDVASGGVKMGEMQAKLLQKVEELTLHVIELKKENAFLKERMHIMEYEDASTDNKKQDIR